MELSSILPEGSLLGAESFQKWDSSRDEKRLTLSINHFVGGVLGGSPVEGNAKMSYVVQVPGKGPVSSSTLHVSHAVTSIGYQSPDLVRSLTEAYRPKMSYALSEVGDGLFDLRGLAYMLGVSSACGSSGVDFTYENPISGVKLLSPTWTVPTTGELTLGPGVVHEKREYVTLMKLAKTAGCKTVQIISDTLPPSTAKPLQGTRLASFSLRVLSALLLSAQGCGCADHHLMAFFRGQSSVYSLWAHTDEGGWVRSALKVADYPPVSGVLASTGDSIIGLPSRRTINAGETTRVSLGLYLTFAGMVPVADSYDSGMPSVFTGEGNRPSDFPGLTERLVAVMEKWRTLAAVTFGLFESQVLDGHSFQSFITADPHDTHLSGEAIIPFWWVEPAPLYGGDTGKLFMPASLSKQVDLPFSPVDTLLVPRMVEDHRGCLSGGGRVRAKLAPHQLRSYAMNFIMSSVYNPGNGLTQVNYVKSARNGVHSTEALFTPEGVVNGADRRWITPHNPVPNPCEGYSDLPRMIEYIYLGFGREPSLQDWSTAKFRSTFGTFYISPPVSTANKRCHRDVPEGMLALVDKYHSDEKWTVSIGSETAMVPYRIDHPPVTPIEETDEPEVELKIVVDPQHTDPDSGDPVQTVPAAPNQGERQNLPTQRKEDEPSQESEEQAPQESA